jgi:exodeoxyribonuclease VII small subunit
MSKPAKKAKSWNYEETVAKIEEIIHQIESGSLPLEGVFEQFGIAVERLQQCEAFLERGKSRLNLLVEQLDGELEF